MTPWGYSQLHLLMRSSLLSGNLHCSCIQMSTQRWVSMLTGQHTCGTASTTVHDPCFKVHMLPGGLLLLMCPCHMALPQRRAQTAVTVQALHGMTCRTSVANNLRAGLICCSPMPLSVSKG